MSKDRTTQKKTVGSKRAESSLDSAFLKDVSAEESAFLSSLDAVEFNALLEERADIARGL